jgi:ketosteroid isomerase-like protein
VKITSLSQPCGDFEQGQGGRITDPATPRTKGEKAMANGSPIKITRKEGGNSAVVALACEAFNAGDVATLTDLFDENSSWHTPGRGSISGSRIGRDAVFAQFGRYGGETGGTLRAKLLNVLESDDGRVVAVQYNCAERNGKRLDVLCCIVFELRNSRIIIGREHFYDLYAWDAYWS